MPAVEVMLLACLTYTASTCCQLLLDERMTAPTAKLALRGAALLGAVLCFAMVSLLAPRGTALLGAVLCFAMVASLVSLHPRCLTRRRHLHQRNNVPYMRCVAAAVAVIPRNGSADSVQ